MLMLPALPLLLPSLLLRAAASCNVLRGVGLAGVQLVLALLSCLLLTLSLSAVVVLMASSRMHCNIIVWSGKSVRVMCVPLHVTGEATM